MRYGQAAAAAMLACNREKRYTTTLDIFEALRAAASDADSTAIFSVPNAGGKGEEEDWSASMSAPRKGLRRFAGYLNLKAEVSVRTVDLSRIVMLVYSHLADARRTGGHAYAVYAHLRDEIPFLVRPGHCIQMASTT